jgi:ActR/RegA family two-component response regulator
VETTPPPQTLLLVGNDTRLGYLLERYSERSGYQISLLRTVPATPAPIAPVPSAVIFLTMEQLETSQAWVAQLTAQDIAILACASPADAARARELGADDCLLHPVTYDDFESLLTTMTGSKQV